MGEEIELLLVCLCGDCATQWILFRENALDVQMNGCPRCRYTVNKDKWCTAWDVEWNTNTGILEITDG